MCRNTSHDPMEPNPQDDVAWLREKRNRRKYHFSGSRINFFFRGDSEEKTKKKIYLLEKETHQHWRASSSNMHYGHKILFPRLRFHLIFIKHKCLRYFFLLWCVGFTRRPFFRSNPLSWGENLTVGEEFSFSVDRLRIHSKVQINKKTKWKFADGNISIFPLPPAFDSIGRRGET